MVLVVALLMESFTAELADERFDALVDSHVRVQCRRPVERLATRATDVRLLGGVDDLVTAEGRRLPEPLVAHLLMVDRNATIYYAALALYFIFIYLFNFAHIQLNRYKI